MSTKSQDNNYIVYKHTAPNGKVYIGITGFDPKYRWLNGRGYDQQSVFFNAIIKYGWINFKHEILFTELTKEEALDKEEQLIRHFKSYDRHYGYNVLLRGSVVQTKSNNGQRQNSRRLPVTPIPEWKNRGKIVNKIDTSGNIIKTYRSVHEFAWDVQEPIETLRTRLNKYGEITYDEYTYKYAQCQIPKVEMLSLDGFVIQTFDNLVEAYKFVNRVNKGGITSVCTGKRESYLGYKWRFKYEN